MPGSVWTYFLGVRLQWRRLHSEHGQHLLHSVRARQIQEHNRSHLPDDCGSEWLSWKQGRGQGEWKVECATAGRRRICQNMLLPACSDVHIVRRAMWLKTSRQAPERVTIVLQTPCLILITRCCFLDLRPPMRTFRRHANAKVPSCKLCRKNARIVCKKLTLPPPDDFLSRQRLLRPAFPRVFGQKRSSPLLCRPRCPCFVKVCSEV